MNMSYCRFQNTSQELVACREALEDLVYGNSEPLSREELAAAKQLASTCWDIVAILAENLGVDTDDLGDTSLIDTCLDRANSATTVQP